MKIMAVSGRMLTDPTAEAAYGRLRTAFECAVSLRRDVRLDFVIAPLPAAQHAAPLTTLMTAYDELVLRASPSRDRFVVTHGEPGAWNMPNGSVAYAA